MNKKGEGEIFIFLILGLLLFSFFSAVGNTDYDDYMKDCKKLNKDNFYYNSTCSLFWEENSSYNCVKTDWDKREAYCQDKWDGKYINSQQSEMEKKDE